MPQHARAADETSSPTPPAEILQQLRAFQETGSVLYVAAHPDDENTQLITYLARGRHIRTAYLSVTRGDGGQNVLGPEFGEKLGVIRTQELLAARRIDGAEQFFTRALDFGFSKDVNETLKNWDREEVVSDIVRVIRTFRPDVMITRFSPTQGGTHGHHTASAVLALEAFKRAGDPAQFPDQLKQGLTPWQPKRILWNGGGSNNATLRIEIGGNDPVTGESLMSMAARSRGMHKSQGFGNFGGGGGGPATRTETFTLLAGDPATNDILDGVDTTWGRFRNGGAEIGTLIDQIIAGFKPDDEAASADELFAIRNKLLKLGATEREGALARREFDYPEGVTTTLPENFQLLNEKLERLNHIIQNCLQLDVRATSSVANVVPGQKIEYDVSISHHSKIPIKSEWVENAASDLSIPPNQTVRLRAYHFETPKTAQLGNPYWLRASGTAAMSRVDDPALIGEAEGPVAVTTHLDLKFGDNYLPLTIPILSGAEGSTPRPLQIVAPVSLHFAAEVQPFTPSAARDAVVELTAARPNQNGTLRLEAPAGWKISPASQPFRLEKAGEHARFSFSVTAPAQPATATLTASAEIDGARWTTDRIEINYPHIPPQLLQPPAREKLVAFELATRGKNIGYIPGAGDDVASCLEQMGYTVTQLGGADLTAENLKKFDAVVIGVRAFNVRDDLVPQLPALFSFVENGGTVVAQYNRPGRDLKTNQPAPYSLTISGDRVTDEHATMTFLAPDHPVLNTPNKITEADFDGWVQERGAYFPNAWDEQHFTPILACHDAGEAPMKGSLLVAQHGKGFFVYTSLGFFRQLPAGVPGAYRLFANLVSLGK